MRINSLEIAWFRGAADPVCLELVGKSSVIYGANGSGKSSFVDAIEYSIAGRIDHLAHEYSGKRQEKGVGNTHAPAGRGSSIQLSFIDKSEETITIDRNGVAARTSSATAAIASWSLKRTILRQDEVAAFIRDTKGAKYSALLPLLGLGPLEVAAENTRQLVRSVDSNSRRSALRAELAAVVRQHQSHFPGKTIEQIRDFIVALHERYELRSSDGRSDADICNELLGAIDRRISDSSVDLRKFIALSDVASSSLASDIAAARTASSRLASGVEPLIRDRLDVLRSAGLYASGLSGDGTVDCPACGQSIGAASLKDHIKSEQARLQELIATSEGLRAAVNSTVASVRAIKSRLSGADARPWTEAKAKGALAGSLIFLKDLDLNQLGDHCDDTVLATIVRNVVPLISAAAEESKSAPPDAAQLSADKLIASAARDILASVNKEQKLNRADALVVFAEALESAIREEIKGKAEAAIKEISADVQTMWAILHPDKCVEDVHLYVAPEAAKGIDIGLKFHGVDQASPRLTLSEGFRNGLGLCIFLAMAKREVKPDRPIILDDVVVSLDRQHRGMVMDVLRMEFAERQVVVLTHDRDWYAELRQSLDEGKWSFRMLLPYETPQQGIRWSRATSTFEEARAQLKNRPDSAGNDARKIMDAELATIAEKLQSRLPFRRGDNNDRRTAHDFLERLIADGKDRFQVMINGKWELHTTAIGAFAKADGLLRTWGNKSSHSFDVVRPEATKLIDACEAVVQPFRCAACKKRVWHAAIGGEKSWQCECGQLRWK